MEKELTLVGHLSELRSRIIVCLAALAIGSLASLSFASVILGVLRLPAAGLIERLVFFSPQEAFAIYMQVAVLCGWFISMPVILYQLWRFISPAIEERLKRHISSLIFFCFIAFVCGGLFAYFILIPPALKFLLSFAKEELEPVISAQKYISFMSGLIWGCGFVFQMPLLSFIFTKTGMINARMLRSKYKYALIAILIIAAGITPTTDVFNMLILALPMVFLYELSIWVSALAYRRHCHLAGGAG